MFRVFICAYRFCGRLFRVFSKSGVNVVVDSSSFELIKGSTIDYTQEMIRSSFAVVNNPQSESACGCGSSFAVKTFAKNPALD
jgi:iron-sulfur cluster assembly 2